MISGAQKIALDAMGGDHAPQVEVEGAVMAAREKGLPVILVGQAQVLERELGRYKTAGLPIEIHHAPGKVEMVDSPSHALKKKRDSSLGVAFDLVKRGEAGAVVSAGNSGAVMAFSMFVLGRLDGVERPAIAGVLPTVKGASVVLDMGANVDCRAIHLVQFAVMGSVYARDMLGKEKPAVAVLSNGEEEEKGNDLTRETHEILKGSSLNYIGYVEGRDVYSGNADVIVCDGFIGNVLLKASEGLAEAIGTMLKREIVRDPLAILGALLVKRAYGRFKKKVDYAEYGGAPLLGVNGLGIICHGGSSPKAIKNALALAGGYLSQRVNERIVEELGRSPELKTLRERVKRA